MGNEPASNRLTLDVENFSDGVLVRCHGKLVAGGLDELNTKVRALISGHKRVVLDLSDVALMDSTGLGMLVKLYVTARSAGCSLELVNLGKRVRELLGVANLLSVFTIIGENSIRF